MDPFSRLAALPHWMIVISAIPVLTGFVLQMWGSLRGTDWHPSRRYFFRLASQVLFMVGVLPLFFEQFYTIVQGQKDTQGKIDEVLKAGEGRLAAQALPPEKAAQIQDLLRPYLRLYFYLEGTRIDTDYRTYGDRAKLVSYEVEL